MTETDGKKKIIVVSFLAMLIGSIMLIITLFVPFASATDDRILSDAGRAIGCNHPLVSFVLQTCVGTCAEQYVYVDLHWLYHIDEIVF